MDALWYYEQVIVSVLCCNYSNSDETSAQH